MSTPRRPRRSKRPKLIVMRERLGMTRPQLAAKIGRARSHIYKIEIGDINPAPDLIMQWLEALGPEASVEIFEPHPMLAQWKDVLGEKLRRSQQLVA
jgi:transcriptional regulator with XRE-family HTH domain